MSIGGGQSSYQSSNAGVLSQSCPIKPMKMFKLPTNEPDEFILPASVKEKASFDETAEDNWALDQDCVEGDDLYEDSAADQAPARSLIRNNWQTNDAEARPTVDISADEFGKNNNARAIFLSQSCPTWGTLSFPERPDSTASAADKAPQEDSSDPAYLDPVLESEEILAAKLSKMSFESVSDMDAIGRSPTIFESLRHCGGLEEGEPLETIAETIPPELEEPEVTSSPAQDDDDELGFQMDE